MERTFRVTVDGQPFMVTVEEVENPGGNAQALPAGGAVSGSVGIAPPTPAQPEAAPAVGAVISHLGGTVDEVYVRVGQVVAAGERLATVEAMKMKNAILASAAGTVRSVEVAAGDTVSAGQVLLRLG
ncbi:hypothetical protein GCM10025771_34240 [Niveibacterium umoris]|uniref:Biotin carboxyl carrier protein n=1 Tax=Niveibacterium umoris TaxID=1193620 RepID=A0A840BII1_9RHOO|nr:biotin/lipoyl-containing protein [Niveibacterium umoris]MBB4011382.1 biotin carboxyl carrier protein [Niveibacterium umoris]